MKRFNWRTSLAGIIAIVSVFLNKPVEVVLQNPSDLATIVAGVGLILARDAANSRVN